MPEVLPRIHTQCSYCSAALQIVPWIIRNDYFCNRVCYDSFRAIPVDPAAKFWSKVNKEPGQGPNGDCWEWVGSTNGPGYGTFFWPGGASMNSHVASYWITTGDTDTKGFTICHTCDNRVCVNPAHLFKGTQGDNMNDMVAKGRCKEGPKHPDAKFSSEQVREIRVRFSTGISSRLELAIEYGVSLGVVCNLIKGRTYKNVK